MDPKQKALIGSLVGFVLLTIVGLILVNVPWTCQSRLDDHHYGPKAHMVCPVAGTLPIYIQPSVTMSSHTREIDQAIRSTNLEAGLTLVKRYNPKAIEKHRADPRNAEFFEAVNRYKVTWPFVVTLRTAQAKDCKTIRLASGGNADLFHTYEPANADCATQGGQCVSGVIEVCKDTLEAYRRSGIATLKASSAYLRGDPFHVYLGHEYLHFFTGLFGAKNRGHLDMFGNWTHSKPRIAHLGAQEKLFLRQKVYNICKANGLVLPH